MPDVRPIGDDLWMAMPDGPEKRNAYYCSRQWGEKKNAVRKRCHNTCERCLDNPVAAIHHLSYIRLYKELLTDLQGLCELCHSFIGGHTDIDPKRITVQVLLQQKALWIRPEFADDCTTVACPYCDSLNCHMGKPTWLDSEGNQGRILIPMWCEGPHEWEMIFDGHKGTLSAWTQNCQDRRISDA
jgi:hypothetical protein